MYVPRVTYSLTSKSMTITLVFSLEDVVGIFSAHSQVIEIYLFKQHRDNAGFTQFEQVLRNRQAYFQIHYTNQN